MVLDRVLTYVDANPHQPFVFGIMIFTAIVCCEKIFSSFKDIYEHEPVVGWRKSQGEKGTEAADRISEELLRIDRDRLKLGVWSFVLFCDIWVAFGDTPLPIQDVPFMGALLGICCGTTVFNVFLLFLVFFMRRDDAEIPYEYYN